MSEVPRDTGILPLFIEGNSVCVCVCVCVLAEALETLRW